MPAQKIVSEGQWKILLDYMEANPIFAQGNVACSDLVIRVENNARWKRLACRLNNDVTGCTKNSIEWRRYWNGIKGKVRAKVCIIRKQMKEAVHGDTNKKYYVLTKKEKRVLQILGILIPQEQMKIKSPPVSPTPDSSQSLGDSSPPQVETSSMDTLSIFGVSRPISQIKSDPDRPLASPLHCGKLEQEDCQAAPSAPEWVQEIEERRIAVEEKSAQALQGIHANTELCVSTLQGIQIAHQCLNKTLQGIQAALEASARTLQERHN